MDLSREQFAAHYVAYNSTHLLALVISQDGPKADLAVFTNMTNAAGVKNFGLQFHQEVEYSREPQPGTFHFIVDERAKDDE